MKFQLRSEWSKVNDSTINKKLSIFVFLYVTESKTNIKKYSNSTVTVI